MLKRFDNTHHKKGQRMKYPLRFSHSLTLTATTLVALGIIISSEPPFAQDDLATQIDLRATQVESKVITWRQDIHQHPELSNREFRTAELVAAQLKSLGLEVQTGVAHTGVVGLLIPSNHSPIFHPVFAGTDHLGGRPRIAQSPPDGHRKERPLAAQVG